MHEPVQLRGGAVADHNGPLRQATYCRLRLCTAARAVNAASTLLRLLSQAASLLHFPGDQ